MRFGYIPVASPLFGEDALNQIIAAYEPHLEHIGGERWDAERLADSAPPFYLVVTGGTEGAILELRASRQAAPDELVFLLAHPTSNSLPAALEVLARLQRDGTPGRIFYLKGPGDTDGYQQVADAVHDLDVRRALRQARIGLVGEPSDWLVASTPDPATVREIWGPEVVPVDFSDVQEMIRAMPCEELASHISSLVDQATSVRGPSEAEIEDVVRVYVALKQVVEQNGLRAVTVRCFDLVLDMKTTGCFALVQLTGVCEPSTTEIEDMVRVYVALKQVDARKWLILYPASETARTS